MVTVRVDNTTIWQVRGAPSLEIQPTLIPLCPVLLQMWVRQLREWEAGDHREGQTLRSAEIFCDSQEECQKVGVPIEFTLTGWKTRVETLEVVVGGECEIGL